MQKNMNICGIENWEVDQRGPICGYLRHGIPDKPVLHLLHGNGFSAMSLLALAEWLPPDWTILATDIPGHGGSVSANDDNPDWTAMADQIAASLHERIVSGLVAGPVVGIGHSMGGVLTLRMAARHPDLFSRLVLLDPVLFPPLLLVAQRVLGMVGIAGKLSLPARTRRRRWQWGSRLEAEGYLRMKKLYRDWHDRAMQGFICTGIHEVDNGGVHLACKPQWESGIFASHPGALWRDVRHLGIRTDILVASEGYGFIRPGARRAARINQHVYIHPVAGSHCFPMEKPEETSALIVACIGVDQKYPLSP